MSDAQTQRLFRAWLTNQTPENAQRYVAALARAGGDLAGPDTVDFLLESARGRRVRKVVAAALRHFFGLTTRETLREKLEHLTEAHYNNLGVLSSVPAPSMGDLREFYKEVGIQFKEGTQNQASADLAVRPKNASGWKTAFVQLDWDHQALRAEVDQLHEESRVLGQTLVQLRNQLAKESGQGPTVDILRRENDRLTKIVQGRQPELTLTEARVLVQRLETQPGRYLVSCGCCAAQCSVDQDGTPLHSGWQREKGGDYSCPVHSSDGR